MWADSEVIVFVSRLSALFSIPELISGDDSTRAPPLPIPNREVKPCNADGTAKAGEQVIAVLLRKPAAQLASLFYIVKNRLTGNRISFNMLAGDSEKLNLVAPMDGFSGRKRESR